MKNKINSNTSEKEFSKKKNIWRDFWVLLKPFHKKFYLLLLLIIAIEGLSLIHPYLLKILIDKLTSLEFGELKDIVYLIFFLFVSEQGVSLAFYLRDRLYFKEFFKIEYFLQVKSQEKLLSLSLNYHEKENTGNKIIKIDRGIQKILDLIDNITWEVVPTVIQLVIAMTVLAIIDWRFSLIIFLFAPFFLFITFYVNKVIYPFRKNRYKKGEEAAGKMAQSIVNINAVKSFVQEKREAREFEKIRNEVKNDGTKEWQKLANYKFGRNAVIDLGRTFVLMLAAWLVYSSQISIGSLVFVITLSEKTFFSLYRLSRVYDRVEEGVVAIERLLKVFNEKQDIKNKKNAIKPSDISGNIVFNKVDFSYNSAKEKALHDVNIEIKAGEVTALVGPSGGGKTTVARMIYRHYDPSRGNIKLDGVDLRDYDLYGFRKFISIVPQEVEIFNASVRDNIAYARPTASQREIVEAARIANAEEFILKLSEKYKTKVGERGIKLSGGQRQRIGIARAILADPKILIFDEATSNLDSYSEKLIQVAMDKITRDRTVIIIAHRLSTIKKADKIIVLSEGMITEQGSHSELAKKTSGIYAKLIKLQEMGELS